MSRPYGYSLGILRENLILYNQGSDTNSVTPRYTGRGATVES
jgi:hypothetical protein